MIFKVSDPLKVLSFSDVAGAWVHSYLSNREQVVVSASGEMSRPVLRNLGVPQGSPNGPGFFSLCINDAPSVLRHCAHHLYADDLTIYIRSSFNYQHNTLQRQSCGTSTMGR